MSVVFIYSDGSCCGNPGVGGWGAVIIYKHKFKEISGHETYSTNNRMEMVGAIEGLQCLMYSCKVIVYTDSKYLFDGANLYLDKWIKSNWKQSAKEPVKNQDLWHKILILREKHDITWRWIKGHAGNVHNERAHVLASQAVSEHKLQLLKSE